MIRRSASTTVPAVLTASILPREAPWSLTGTCSSFARTPSRRHYASATPTRPGSGRGPTGPIVADVAERSGDLWASFQHDPRDPAVAPLRASDADRNLVHGVLTEAFADGRLDREEY